MFAIVNGIIMVPLYLKYMPLSTYGAWLASGNVIGLIGVVESGFSTVITQKMAVAYALNEKEQFGRLATANFVVAFLMAFIIFLGGLAFCNFIPNWINAEGRIHQELKWAILISSLATASTILFSLVGVIPQVIQKTFFVGVINTLSIILGLSVTFFSIINDVGIVSIALGYFTRSFTNFIATSIHVKGLWVQYDLPPLRYSAQVVKELINACILPFVAKLSSTIVNNSQNFIIANTISPASAAIYEITSKIVTVIRMFVNMMNGSVMSSFALIFANEDINYQKESYKKLSVVFFTLLFSGMLFSYLFTQPIIHFWVGDDKFGGYLLLGLIILASLTTEIKSFFNNLLMSMGLIKHTAKLDIYNSGIFIVSLVVFNQFFPLLSIPLSILSSSFLFMLLFGQMIAKRFGGTNISIYKSSIETLTLSCLFTFISFLLPHQKITHIYWFLLKVIFVVSLYFIILIRINFGLRSILKTYFYFPLKRKYQFKK